MDAQAKVQELRSIEKELMELERRTAELVRRRRELLDLLPERDSPRKQLSMEEMQRILLETASLGSKRRQPSGKP